MLKSCHTILAVTYTQSPYQYPRVYFKQEGKMLMELQNQGVVCVAREQQHLLEIRLGREGCFTSVYLGRRHRFLYSQ